MSVEFIFRLIGLLVFGLGGFYLGQALVRAGGVVARRMAWSPSSCPSWRGGLVGFVITPFLTTRPYRALQQRIKQTPATDLVGGHHRAGPGAADCRAAVVSAVPAALAVP